MAVSQDGSMAVWQYGNMAVWQYVGMAFHAFSVSAFPMYPHPLTGRGGVVRVWWRAHLAHSDEGNEDELLVRGHSDGGEERGGGGDCLEPTTPSTSQRREEGA